MSDHDAHGFALGSYLLGALGPEERRQVDEHLASSAPCRDELARLALVPAAPAKLSLQDLEREGTLEPPATLAVANLTGKVTLEKKRWGTELLVTASGLPRGTSCVAVVRGRDGAAQVAGSWGPTPTGTARVELATSLPPASLAGLTIETPSGHPLLSATLSA